MKIENLPLDGLILIHGDRFFDERGFFSETYNKRRYQDLGIAYDFVQDNLSMSSAGVFRGMHWQSEPAAQGKLVTCLSGEIEDFVIDIRRNSPTFKQTLKVPLSAKSLVSLWVPPGFAHGFLSLQVGTMVNYKVTNFWSKESEKSCNPFSVGLLDLGNSNLILSEKDALAPNLEDVRESDLF